MGRNNLASSLSRDRLRDPVSRYSLGAARGAVAHRHRST